MALVLSPSAYATDLQQAFIDAYQHNPTLLAERANLKATDEQIAQAYSGFLPHAGLEWSKGEEKIERNNRYKNDGTTHAKDLVISQPLFKGGETLFQISRAKHVIKAGQAALLNVEQNVFLETATAYMDLLQAQEVLKLSQKNEEVLRKHLQSAEERFKLGEVTRTDVAQAKARLSRAISEKTRALGDVNTALATYKRIVGTEPLQLVVPSIPANLPANIEDATKIALMQNPELEAAKFNVMASKDVINISKAALLPDVNLRSEIRKTEGYASFGRGDYDTKTATLTVSVPLYQSGAEYSKIRANKRLEERRKFEAKSVYDQVIEKTVRAWRNLEVAKSNVKSRADAVEAASVALEGVTQEAALGSRTTLDVLDAEQELFMAQVEKARAKRDEIVSSYQLKAAMGQLSAKILALPIKIYDSEEYYRKNRFKFIGY